MRNFIIISTLIGLCGCSGLHNNSAATEEIGSSVVTKPGDTLAAIATQRYGVPEYAELIAYHNELPSGSTVAGVRIDLPAIDKMVSSMSALEPHRETVVEILGARAQFSAIIPYLRRERGSLAIGEDKELSAGLQRKLALVIDQLKRADAQLTEQRENKLYPERLHAAIENVAEEIRMHASGRYYGCRLSIDQSERQVARIFIELLTLQRVLSGDFSPQALVYPKCKCG